MIWPQWDRSIFLAVNGIHSGLLTSLMRTITNVDYWIPFLIVGIAALLWLGRTAPVRRRTGGRWRKAFQRRNPRMVILCLVLATAASDQVSYHIKDWVGRPRPCFDEEFSHLVEYRGDVHGNRSFPSSHAANSAALATTASLAYPPLAPYAALLAFMVGLSRIYLGVHYPIDVLTGWGIGISCAVLVWMILRRWVDRPGVIGFTGRFRCRQPFRRADPPDGWREERIGSLDGYTAEGYFRRAGERLAVVVHGLHEDISAIFLPGQILARKGLSVLLVPLRGHDGHPVPVTSGGPAEAYDLAGALLHAETELGFSRSDTVIFGTSMGGSVAMKVAGLLDREVAGVILWGAFSDFFGSAENRLGGFRSSLLKLFLPPGVRYGLKDFRPLDYACRCTSSRFVYITGELDRISPPEVSRTMARITGGRILVLEKRRHPVWDIPDMEGAQTVTALDLAVDTAYGKDTGNCIVDVSGKYRSTGREI